MTMTTREEQIAKLRTLWGGDEEKLTELTKMLTRIRSRAMREARHERNEVLAILRRFLESPYGCGFCDSGKLRNPNKPHDDDCPFLQAERMLA